jgi:LacI family transcriptional regulator
MSLSKETQFKGDFHHISEVISQGMPVVMFDRVTADINCDKVIIDDTAAAYNAVKLLLETGKKRIALVTTSDYVSVGKYRTEGYLKAIKEKGIAADEQLIVKIEDVEKDQKQINNLLNVQGLDAVFAVNEVYAVTVIKAAARRQLQIPSELSVVAFSDGIISRYSSPSITTVSQNGTQMGMKAAEMPITRLENEEEDDNFRTEIIETHLVRRESTIC